MNITIISHLYPATALPFQGKFIQDHVKLLEASDSLKPSLIVPTPYALPFTSRWHHNHDRLIPSGCPQKRCRYLSIPRRKLPALTRSTLSSALLSELNNQNPDIIHLHWLFPDGISIPALKKAGYTCVLTVHGSDWYKSLSSPSLMKILQESLNTADRILCSGPDLKSDIAERFPEIQDKIIVIYNMVDPDKYYVADSARKSELRTTLNWDNNATHSLTVANIRHEKGIDVLLEAASNDDYENHYYHIIGKDDRDEYSRSLHAYCSEQNLSNVVFHQPVSPDLLSDYYDAADFYVLPSRSEGFNVSLLEATASGLPVVATEAGSSDRLIDETNGELVPPEDTVALQQAIQRMTTNYMKYDRQRIRSNTIKQYGTKPFLQKLTDLYRQALDSAS